MARFFVRHRYLLGIAAVLLVTAPLGVVTRPLWVGDETREVAIAQEMARSGHFLRTKLAGRPLTEKPPFFYASVASAIRLGKGVTPLSTRFPSILFSALTLFSASAAAALLFSARAGLLTSVILSTTYLFAINAHDCVVDVGLAAFVTSGMLAFVAGSRRAGYPRWDLAFGLAAAGALLVKGFVGVVLLFILTIPFWLWSSARKPLLRSASAGALLVPLAALIVWTAAAYREGGFPGLSETLWTQQVGRFVGFRGEEYSHHRAPLHFYLAAMPGMFFPWIVSLPAAAGLGVRDRGRRSSLPASLPLLMGLLLSLLLLSFAGTKRTVYFLPLVPVAAILVGSFLDAEMLERSRRISRWLWAQFSAIAVAAVGVPLVPALSDGRLTPSEIGLLLAVTTACGLGALLARGSPARLVTVCVVLAIFSLVLFDSYSLPLLDRDRGARQFFGRVARQLSPTDRVYSFGLNENVLGRACIDLVPGPIAETSSRRLIEKLAGPRAFLLAETATVRRGAWAGVLEPVVVGLPGNRSVALYRLRRPREHPRMPLATALARLDALAGSPDGGSSRSRPVGSSRARTAFSYASWGEELVDGVLEEEGLDGERWNWVVGEPEQDLFTPALRAISLLESGTDEDRRDVRVARQVWLDLSPDDDDSPYSWEELAPWEEEDGLPSGFPTG